MGTGSRDYGNIHRICFYFHSGACKVRVIV
jgi:hypothetical protein